MAEHPRSEHQTRDIRKARRDQNIVECERCGTRLRRNDEPHPTEVGTDSFRPIARHRCAPSATRTPSLSSTNATLRR
jgi:hypothetical protein